MRRCGDHQHAPVAASQDVCAFAYGGQLDSLTRIAVQQELVSLWQRAGFTALLVTHDVEEALFLANRVIVLSERPARIMAQVVNGRPYPRHRGDPHLAALRREIMGHLGLAESW